MGGLGTFSGDIHRTPSFDDFVIDEYSFDILSVVRGALPTTRYSWRFDRCLSSLQKETLDRLKSRGLTVAHLQSWTSHPEDGARSSFNDSHERALEYLMSPAISLDGAKAIAQIDYLGHHQCETLVRLYARGMRGDHLRSLRSKIGIFNSEHAGYLVSLMSPAHGNKLLNDAMSLLIKKFASVRPSPRFRAA